MLGRIVPRRTAQPWVLAGVVIATAFVIELIIMLLGVLPGSFSTRAMVLALLDATALSVVLVPVLWLLLVRPVRRLAEERGRLLDQLIESRDLERARLAAELHDQLGQELTAVLLGLGLIRDASTVERSRGLAEETLGVVTRSMATVRRISRGLAPPTLADFGLAPAIEQLVNALPTHNGLDIVLAIDPALPRLSSQTETAVFRVAQESLTNILRHAGASKATLTLKMDRDRLRLTVEDDGVGVGSGLSDLTGRDTMGVRGMRQRVESLGGVFQVRSGSSGGTVVHAVLPRTEPDGRH